MNKPPKYSYDLHNTRRSVLIPRLISIPPEEPAPASFQRRKRFTATGKQAVNGHCGRGAVLDKGD